MSDSDATTFGVGGGYFTPGLQKTINGVVFNEFLQGIAILNNVGPHLTAAACLQDAVTHVLGHAVGLGHSTDGAAVMYPTLRAGCASASSLASDDINGLRAIYPSTASGGNPPQAPTALTNSVSLDTVTLSWTPSVGGGPAQSYILEAGSSPGLANITTIVLNSPNTSTVVGAVPAGVYYVRVRARNALGTSGPSPDTVVSVGPCSAPTVPTNLGYSTADNLVTLTWTPPAGGVTQGYWLYAGYGPGQSNALVTSLGPTPGFVGTAGVGDYYVRIAGRNTCAIGPQSAELLVSVRACTALTEPARGAVVHQGRQCRDPALAESFVWEPAVTLHHLGGQRSRRREPAGTEHRHQHDVVRGGGRSRPLFRARSGPEQLRHQWILERDPGGHSLGCAPHGEE